jgi:carboxypeptidase C (cathepsin A)
VASGRYDLATPYFATQYTLDHLGLNRELAGHVNTEHYPAGHMMYIEPESFVKLKKDLAKFYRTSVRTGSAVNGR